MQMLYYEYGYLCFQVIVLTVQMAIICRGHGDGFNAFKAVAKKCAREFIPELIAMHTGLQVFELCDPEVEDESLSWIIQAPTTPKGKRTFLPAVGGLNDVDAMFLLREMWESRKQLSYIGAKVPTDGWSFILQLIREHLTGDLRKKKVSSSLFLNTACAQTL